MDASGQVVWEVRPTSKDVFEEAVADAGRLLSLRSVLAKKQDDMALAASVALLDAMGRGQRAGPSVDEVDAFAKVKGIRGKEDLCAKETP